MIVVNYEAAMPMKVCATTTSIDPNLINSAKMEAGKLSVIAAHSLGFAIEVSDSTLTKYKDMLYRDYPNRRILHLALHHSKARVRKKNRHRIARELKKFNNLT